jgi:hypothetical protein
VDVVEGTRIGLRKRVICFGFVFLSFATLVACSSLPIEKPYTPITDIIPTILATKHLISPTPEFIIPSTVITPQAISTSALITPDVKIITLEVREVDLADLGLIDSTRLILYYKPSNSMRIMSAQDIRPQKIPNIDPEARFSRYNLRHISPDRKWFVYYTFTEIKDNLAYYDFWVSSVDGEKQWVFATGVKGGTDAAWVTNDQIELWYSPARGNCHQRVAIVNPFSRETTVPPEVPSSPMPHCVLPLSTSPDNSKLIFREEGTGKWSIFDFNTGTKQSVFPWLSQSDAYNLVPRFIRWLPSGITYALPNGDSIEFIVDLSPSSASSIDSKRNKLKLPAPYEIVDKWFSWWSLDNGLIGFDMVQANYNSPTLPMEESPPSIFVIFDLRNSILYDYNLDRANTGDMQKVSDPFVSASADNRFLAWTIYEPPDMSYPSETAILEIATGRVARIKGFEFFGWGEVDEP